MDPGVPDNEAGSGTLFQPEADFKPVLPTWSCDVSTIKIFMFCLFILRCAGFPIQLV